MFLSLITTVPGEPGREWMLDLDNYESRLALLLEP